MPTVVGVAFRRGASYDPREKHGDFEVMVREEVDALLLFNDNFQDRESSLPGSGNAIVRPHASSGLTAGVPTGWSPGRPFEILDDPTMRALDLAFERIRTWMRLRACHTVFYSVDPLQPPLVGTCTFVIPRAVRFEITRRILTLATPSVVTRSLTAIAADERSIVTPHRVAARSVVPSLRDVRFHPFAGSRSRLAAPARRPLPDAPSVAASDIDDPTPLSVSLRGRLVTAQVDALQSDGLRILVLDDDHPLSGASLMVAFDDIVSAKVPVCRHLSLRDRRLWQLRATAMMPAHARMQRSLIARFLEAANRRVQTEA